jgi:hypothetical protein
MILEGMKWLKPETDVTDRKMYEGAFFVRTRESTIQDYRDRIIALKQEIQELEDMVVTSIRNKKISIEWMNECVEELMKSKQLILSPLYTEDSKANYQNQYPNDLMRSSGIFPFDEMVIKLVSYNGIIFAQSLDELQLSFSFSDPVLQNNDGIESKALPFRKIGSELHVQDTVQYVYGVFSLKSTKRKLTSVIDKTFFSLMSPLNNPSQELVYAILDFQPEKSKHV